MMRSSVMQHSDDASWAGSKSRMSTGSMSSPGWNGDRAEPVSASDWWRAEGASKQTWLPASGGDSAPPSDVSLSLGDLHINTQWSEFGFWPAMVIVLHLQAFHHHQATCTINTVVKSWFPSNGDNSAPHADVSPSPGDLQINT